MKGGKAAPKSVKKSGATVSKGKSKSTEGEGAKSSEDVVPFVLFDSCSGIVRYCDHSLLRRLQGRCEVDDFLTNDDVESMVAAIAEEDSDKDEKRRDAFGPKTVPYKGALLLDFMMVFGTVATAAFVSVGTSAATPPPVMPSFMPGFIPGFMPGFMPMPGYMPAPMYNMPGYMPGMQGFPGVGPQNQARGEQNKSGEKK